MEREKLNASASNQNAKIDAKTALKSSSELPEVMLLVITFIHLLYAILLVKFDAPIRNVRPSQHFQVIIISTYLIKDASLVAHSLSIMQMIIFAVPLINSLTYYRFLRRYHQAVDRLVERFCLCCTFCRRSAILKRSTVGTLSTDVTDEKRKISAANI